MAVLGFTYNQEPITHYRPLQTLFLHFCSYLYDKCNTFIAIKQIKLKHFSICRNFSTQISFRRPYRLAYQTVAVSNVASPVMRNDEVTAGTKIVSP